MSNEIKNKTYWLKRKIRIKRTKLILGVVMAVNWLLSVGFVGTSELNSSGVKTGYSDFYLLSKSFICLIICIISGIMILKLNYYLDRVNHKLMKYK